MSSVLYDSTGKNTLLPRLNQPFQDTETRINKYIPTSGKYISSSYATTIPQSYRRGLQIQVDQLGGYGTYLIPTQQQTRFQTMYSKQCANHSQMGGTSEDTIYILGISIYYSRWTCNHQGILTKRQGRWKSCGHFVPLPSGKFSKSYQHRVGG